MQNLKLENLNIESEEDVINISFTVKEICSILRISYPTVLNMIKNGALTGIKVGNGGKTSPYRIYGQSLKEFLTSKDNFPKTVIREDLLSKKEPEVSYKKILG